MSGLEDPDTGEVACREVVDPYENPDRAIIELELYDEATGTTEVIETTDNHPFYVLGRGFTRVDELQPGDQIPTGQGGLLSARRVYLTGRIQPVYNFGVADFHTYFVGEVGAWVHNCWKNGAKDAYKHFKKHKSDFPHLNNAKEYVEEATHFLNNPPSSAHIFIRERDGTKIVYDSYTNRLGFQTSSGSPASYYKPNPSIHGESTDWQYIQKIIK